MSNVGGTGPRGSITSDDIDAAAKQAEAALPKEAAPAVEIPALSAVARLMAERTAMAWNAVPHFFLACDVDMTAIGELRESLNIEVADGAVRVTVSDLLMALTARVLRKHPKLNASWVQNSIRINSAINISLAIAVKDGVVAGVIRDVDQTDMPTIAAKRKDLADRARANQLRPSDLDGGTFTISNLGMYGIDSFLAIVVPPQSAILATGRINDRVVAVEGKMAIRPMMTLTLSSDHRVIDGAQAAVFLRDLAAALAKPRSWL
jgi:pyruvate dehydrogenase E2 component (dihydrolipoamide acetyltransferase)